jgi:imidazolonepropionase-like amidohydrolase
MVPWAIEKAKSQWDLMCESYKRIHRQGAILAAGTDSLSSPMMPLGTNALELELLVKYCGFTPMEAIVAATKNGALASFLGDQTGTLEAGKFADIIIVDGNPLTDIRILQNVEKIKMVMLQGNIEIYRGNARL